MANRILSGRHRATFPPGTVVFLIGMHINSLRKVRAWIPPFLAMPRMLAELAQQPELGLLEARTEIGWRRATVVQYWASMEQLMAYASSSDRKHLPAWKAYNQASRAVGDAVGIWHEAYMVDPDRSHIVYRNMPEFGMGKATVIEPAVPGGRA